MLYLVSWEERMSATISANSKEEAREKVLKGNVQAEGAELISDIEVTSEEEVG